MILTPTSLYLTGYMNIGRTLSTQGRQLKMTNHTRVSIPPILVVKGGGWESLMEEHEDEGDMDTEKILTCLNMLISTDEQSSEWQEEQAWWLSNTLTFTIWQTLWLKLSSRSLSSLSSFSSFTISLAVTQTFSLPCFIAWPTSRGRKIGIMN